MFFGQLARLSVLELGRNTPRSSGPCNPCRLADAGFLKWGHIVAGNHARVQIEQFAGQVLGLPEVEPIPIGNSVRLSRVN